ncbi:MAG: hypothetical protein AB8B61_09770 [Cyclobacteriaceae bacterium]
MTINKAKDFLESLLNNSTTKRETRIYQKFILVLTGLENRDLPRNQVDLIEQELAILDLKQQTKNRKKYIRQRLNEFLKYIDTAFSFVLKGHYANYGLSLGMVFGLALGTAVFRDSGSSTTGMCIGMFIEYIIGQYMDTEAAKNNRVLIIA